MAGPQHHALAERRLRQALRRSASTRLDPVKRAALFIQMNDLVIKNVVVIPVVYRPTVAAVANKLHVPLRGWDSYYQRPARLVRDA